MLLSFRMLLIAILLSITVAHVIIPRPVIDCELRGPSHNGSHAREWHHHVPQPVIDDDLGEPNHNDSHPTQWHHHAPRPVMHCELSEPSDDASHPRHQAPEQPVMDDGLGNPSYTASDQENCTVKQFWTPKPPQAQDWADNNVDAWLDTWFTTNSKSIKDHGFAKAWGLWALGTPDFTCHYDGSTSNCDFQASCDNQVLNGKGKDLRQAYYVTEAVV